LATKYASDPEIHFLIDKEQTSVKVYSSYLKLQLDLQSAFNSKE